MNNLNFAFGVAIIALTNASTSFAQENASDIIVTARRIEERLQDVPISITAFSQQQLTNRNIVNAGDIASYTPSLSSNSRFGPEKTSFSIRGFNQDNGTAPSVGVYFADAPALRSIGGTTTGNGAGPGAFFDLASLQVLKGPQGTLFGRNTSGGAVLLVPQKPTGRLEGYIEGSVGNYDLRRVQAVLNVPVNDTLRVRLGVDRNTRTGYMKNASNVGHADYNDIDYRAARISVVADLTPNLENYFIGTYSKSSTHGAMPRLIACDSGQGPNGAGAAGTTPALELNRLACNQVARANGRDFYTGENAMENTYQKIQQWQIINNTSWKATDNLTIKNIVSYGEFRERLRASVYGENLLVETGPDAGQHITRASSNPFTGRNGAAQSTFSEELQFQGSLFTDRLNWQAGLYMEVSNPLGFSGSLTMTNGGVCLSGNYFECRSFIPSAATTAATSAGRYFNPSTRSNLNKYSFQDYGAYAQGTFKLNEKFSLTAGIRYTRDDYQATSRYINYTSPSAPISGFPMTGSCGNTLLFGTTAQGNIGKTSEQCETYVRGHSSAPTWLVDIDYKPTSDILLYAKYARGYRQGQIKADGFGREAFNPEKIEAYEVGLKTSWRGPVRGTFNIAGFYNDLANQQISTSGNFVNTAITPANIITNAGKSTFKGVEIDSSFNFFRSLTIDVGYAYLDTKIKSIASIPGDGVLFSSFVPTSAGIGLPLIFTPKNKYTLTATYVLPVAESIGKISVGATFTHTDSYESTYQTYACQAPVGSTCGNAPNLRSTLGYDIGRIPAYDLLNVNLNWNSVAGSPVDLCLFATNVTGKQYYTAAFGGYTSFGFEGASVGEPRTYGLRLKYRFGN